MNGGAGDSLSLTTRKMTVGCEKSLPMIAEFGIHDGVNSCSSQLLPFPED